MIMMTGVYYFTALFAHGFISLFCPCGSDAAGDCEFDGSVELGDCTISGCGACSARVLATWLEGSITFVGAVPAFELNAI